MTEDALAAQLGLTVTGVVDLDAMAIVQPWLRKVVRQVPEAAPPVLVVDVGRLVTRGPQRLQPPAFEPSGALRGAHSAYSEHVVGRIRGAAGLRAIVDAAATGKLAEDPTPAVVAVVGRIMQRLARHERLPAVGVSRARRLFSRSSEEILEAATRAFSDLEVREAVADDLRMVTAAAKRVPRLIESTDAFVVRHLHELGSASDLLAFEQAVDAASLLSARVPKRVRRPKSLEGGARTQVADETTYPVGGYAEIASHGPLENLVSSELVYLEPEAELDLFDLRYVTGELLKFVRDEGVWSRPRRTVDVVVGAALLGHRVKVPNLPYQVAVMVQGSLLVLVDRLVQWLSTEALEVRVWVEDPRGDLTQEAARLALALADPIELGVVTVDTLGAGAKPPAAEGQHTCLRLDFGHHGAALGVLGDGTPAVEGLDIRLATPDVAGWGRALAHVAAAAL